MASRRIEDLHPDLQPIALEFVRLCAEKGVDVLIYCTYRSDTEQDILYTKGRTTPGPKVTNARAGQSRHNDKFEGKPAARAFDAAPLVHGKIDWSINNPAWVIMGEVGQSLGLTWYGAPNARFREMPHFQL